MEWSEEIQTIKFLTNDENFAFGTIAAIFFKKSVSHLTILLKYSWEKLNGLLRKKEKMVKTEKKKVVWSLGAVLFIGYLE